MQDEGAATAGTEAEDVVEHEVEVQDVRDDFEDDQNLDEGGQGLDQVRPESGDRCDASEHFNALPVTERLGALPIGGADRPCTSAYRCVIFMCMVGYGRVHRKCSEPHMRACESSSTQSRSKLSGGQGLHEIQLPSAHV